MIALTEDVYKLFDNVTEEVSRNVRHLMQQLWLNWSHVGVEYDVKVNNIQKLVQIEKDLHSDVLDETKQKLKVMQHQVTDLNMDRLAKLRQDLQEKYDQTNNRVLELRERLSRLWECLDEDQIYRDNFLQAHPGCTPSTEAAIKEEIKRCEQIKRQKIQVFVANMRTKIKLMWDNIMYSSREREEFLHYYQDIFTEDTLTLHEMYLEKITKFYNEHKNIFDLVVTRKNLWLKQAEMDARASEPGRYHNRGGNLLREEKERKAIETNERHNKLSARKQALTPSNPLLRSLATSPLGKRNRTAAGLAHTAERTRRVSGRLATKALVVKAESNGATVKRKLEYGGDTQKTPKANGSILKHKRTSIGKRRSGGRRSNGARNTVSSENARKNPLMETTKLTSYSDFKVRQCKRNSDELQAFMTSPTPSLIPPNKAVYLEADPFDYEIVNIDYNKLRVRKAEVIDVPQIINLIQTLEGKETMWIVENSIMGKKQHQAYVFMSGVTLVGYGIVEPPEQINFIQAKFNLDYYHIGKYHNRGHGASVGFATLKTTLVYPVIHKANTMAIAMVPLLPRKSESICGLIPQLKNLGVFSRKIAGSPYLTFTNVTLVSPSGLPFIRHCKPHVEMMFLRHRTTTDQFLKSTPYTYYLNVVVGTVVDINKSGNIPPYSRLDDPSYREPQINTYYETPDNVFIVNSLTEANKALRFVKNFYYRNNQVIVYGAYLHAYCCIAALLEMEIPARNITFVEPFPPEDPTKPRIPVFSNIYVDQTMREVLNELGISVYRSYYFQSWNVDMYNMATHVNFLSHFQMVELECSAMFYYGVKGIDANAFQAIHRSGMAYDAGILIDHQFRTNDPSIFAAGPSTRYCPRYFAEFKKQKFYDSYEVGEKGYILETFQGGYFKLHLTADSIVDGITCLSPESYSIGHFKNLYGKSAVVLNNVHIKFAKIDDPLPERVCGRDMVVAKETYRTTTGEYCVKPNPNKAMERADCSINCRRVIFMTGVEKRLQGKTITQPTMISETKDTYRGIAKSPLMPPAVTVRGFGPRHKEIWMPLTAKVHRAVYDRIHVKKECHEVAAVFQSETKKKFQVPFALSPLASWSHGEVFDLAPFPPNPYQTNIAPFMYCSDYCHISQGTPPYTVENVVVHVGYEQKIFRHDIALIVLKDEMKYSVSVAPICLNDKPEIVINERALLVGWGKLSGQNNLPSQFKKASEDSKVWAKMYYLYFKPISNIISCSPNTQYKEQWLLTKGKMSAVVKNIENAAKLNKLEIKENLSMLSCEKNASSNFVAVIVETLKSKSLLKRFFICIIWWNTCTFVDHGLTLNSVLLKGNKYFNYGLVASLACQEWKRTLVGTAHAAGYMLGIFFVGSLSDRWLLTKGKKNTVVMNIENAAKLNKIEIKENLSTLSYEKETSSNFMAVIAKTFKSKSLLKRFFVCIIWWNTCTFVDHGLLINSVLLKGNRYVNYGVISFKWFNIDVLISMTLVESQKNLGTLARFGRKPLAILAGVTSGVCGLAKSFASTYWIYIVFEFLEAAFGEIHSPLFMLAIEMVSTKSRVKYTMICTLGFPIGGVLFPLIYWLISYWRTFLRVLYASGLLFILAFFFLDESPRWHLTKGHIEAAVKILNKAAKINKVEIEESLEMLTYEKDDSSNFTTAITDTFKSRALLKSCLACMVWWIVAVFANYGLSINSVSLNGDKYVNYALSAAVQVPSFVITTCLMDKFNRKVVLMWSFVACGVLCVSQPFIPNILIPTLQYLIHVNRILINNVICKTISIICVDNHDARNNGSALFKVSNAHDALSWCTNPELCTQWIGKETLNNHNWTNRCGVWTSKEFPIELVATKSRVKYTTACKIGLSIGGIIFPLMYWLISYWRTFLKTLYAPPLLFICAIYYLDESPRWLLSKGNTEAAVKIIDNASKMNKIEIKENLAMLSYEEDASLDFKTVLVATLKSRTLLKTFFACVTWWITSTFVSHGLSINSVFLKGNKFINYALASVVEIPGNIFAAYLMDKFNRKLPLIFSFVACAVLCAVQPFIPNDLLWLTISIYMVGKLVSTTFFTITYIFTSELFPTYTRNSMHALCSSVGRIGGLAAPQTPLLTDEKEKEAENNYFNLKLFLYQTLYAEEKKKKYKKDYGDDEKQQSIILYPKQIKTSTKSKVVEGRSKIARLSELLKMLTDVLRRIIRVKNGKSFASTEVVRGCPTKKRKIKPMLCHPNSIDKQLGSQHQQIYLEEKSSVKKLRYQTTPYPVQATVEAFCIMSMQVMKEVMDYMMVSTTTDLTMVMATNMSMVMNIMISIITIQAITVMATSAITIIWGTDIIISITIFITSKAMTDDQKAIIRQHFEQLSMECIKDNPITSDDIASLKAKKMDESGMLQKETILQKAKAMTMKQIRNTGKMIRKSCQPKNNVEDEKIDPIKDGVFIEEKEVMCYMACVMKMANTMDGKGMFDVAGAEAMVEKTHGDDTTMIENSKKLFDVCKSDGIQDIKEDIIMLHIAS
ncbi:hypothetical protein MSG28_004620 [Choristoneura fumiferana]|uniref:Uncharacterized protein n=1 Tax=Choristoneura fumiferana TaxID=7141 RepID=A0ACC0K6N1_CHOFU|nr:hypothetical protein MSG28_004620 [Choristoneura fumiferana]